MARKAQIRDIEGGMIRSRGVGAAAAAFTGAAMVAGTLMAASTEAGPPSARATAIVERTAAEGGAPAVGGGAPAVGGNAPCEFGSASNRMRPAMEEIQRIGWGPFAYSYAGLRVCKDPRRVLVFRKPSAAFDRAAKGVAARHDVRLKFATAKASRSEMAAASRQVDARRPELEAHGISLQTVTWKPEGLLLVGVRGDLNTARRILRDVAHVIVVGGSVAQ